MLNMLNVFGGPFQKIAYNSGNVKYVKYVKCLGEIGLKTPKHLTYLTFPLL